VRGGPPPETLLEAECILPEDEARAAEEYGEDWMFAPYIYTQKRFPDTLRGLRAAFDWAVAHDTFGEARVERLVLRRDWRRLKPECWYEGCDDIVVPRGEPLD
jgi:hypothetical protein